MTEKQKYPETTKPKASIDTGLVHDAHPKSRQAVDGIKAIRTTNVFRLLNFELYAKPNIVVMTFGVLAFLCSGAYLAYLKSQMVTNNTYVAIADDESQTLTHRKSKWD